MRFARVLLLALCLSVKSFAQCPNALDETTRSFWHESASRRFPAVDRDLLAVDAVIIGGGITGLSTAIHLKAAQPNRTVVLLEGGVLGSGASGRNGGLVLTQAAADYMHLSSPPAIHRRMYDLTARSILDAEALLRSEGLEAGWEHKGSLLVYRGQRAAQRAKAYATAASDLGMPIERWERDRLEEILASPRYDGALYDPAGASLHPMKWIDALTEIARRRGVLIFEDTPVQSIVNDEKGVTVKLDGKPWIVQSRRAVLASNVFSLRLGYFRSWVFPLHTDVGVTRPFSPEELARLGWRSPLKFCDSKTFVHYCGVTADGRLHIGGGQVRYRWGNDTETRPAPERAREALETELHRIYPNLAGEKLEHVWSGVLDITADSLPSVGGIGRRPSIFYSIGMNGHGVNLSFLHGQILADLVAGNEERWHDYPYLNHRGPWLPPEPARWLALRVYLPWLALLDARE